MTVHGYREPRRSYSTSNMNDSNASRVEVFIASWRQVPRSNPRRAQGKRILELIDPSRQGSVDFRKVQPRGVQDARLWAGAPSPATMALLQRELDALGPGISDIRAALASGEPVSLTIDSFTSHGLGSFKNPVVPFYIIPDDERARRAVVHGNACMSRNRATRIRPAPPMLIHQFIGQTLWLYWPCTPFNLAQLEPEDDVVSWTRMVTELEQMHAVVLRPGECFFMPSMSSYITLSLGFDGTNMAAHLKYSLLPQQRLSTATSTTTITTTLSTSEEARPRPRPSFESRIAAWFKGRDRRHNDGDSASGSNSTTTSVQSTPTGPVANHRR